MLAFLDVRISLELKALELAKPHLVRADLEAMLHGNRPSAGGQLDNTLHRYLIEKSGNFYLRDFFDRHGLYFTMLFDYAAPAASVTRVMATTSNDPACPDCRRLAASPEALAHHIRSQRPVLRRLLQLIGDRDDSTKKTASVTRDDRQ